MEKIKSEFFFKKEYLKPNATTPTKVYVLLKINYKYKNYRITNIDGSSIDFEELSCPTFVQLQSKLIAINEAIEFAKKELT